MNFLRSACYLPIVCLMVSASHSGTADILEPASVPEITIQALRLACDNVKEDDFSLAFSDVVSSARQDLVRGETIFGWRQKIEFDDQTQVVVQRIAPQGQLRRVSVEQFKSSSRPAVLLVSDQNCQIHQARIIRYEDDVAVGLQPLNSELVAEGSEIPMNPPVPTGVDPGGVPVALVDSGVNYLLPEIQSRLARELDGRMIGFDYWEMDDRPFDSHPTRSVFFPQRHGTRIASIILREASSAKILPYRYPRPDMSRMHQLIALIARSGARIVNMSLGSNTARDWDAFEGAARRHPHLLFIVSAGNNNRDIDIEPVYPASLTLKNMLVVTSSAGDGYPAEGSNWGTENVDLLVPGERIPAIDFSGEGIDVSGSSYAVARITALAARILTENPDLDAMQLKAKILSLATPERGAFVKSGWIKEPSDLIRDQDLASIQVITQETFTEFSGVSDAVFRPMLVFLSQSGWTADRVQTLIQSASRIIQQCNIVIRPASLVSLATNDGIRDFSMSNAKLITKVMKSDRASVFFVRDTVDRPAFDAVAFGTRNSVNTPELRFTAWVTTMTVDPHIALAHELVHVLMDDGTHSYAPRNLMRGDTSPNNLELTAAQCELMQRNARANGLLE
ncbi:MAG: S8 family serine peptidase [Proteobacteria bacterium]|nr:S8 family serine peptidase [Pseudomonadota bacterium]